MADKNIDKKVEGKKEKKDSKGKVGFHQRQQQRTSWLLLQ